jgi:hypothetical protein
LWKRPATFALERRQHFMDLEIYERAFAKHPEIKTPFALSRQDFESKFPEIGDDAGRAYWRIRELSARLEKIAARLRVEGKEALSGQARQDVQEDWLVTAGVMGHYIGDLGQPLHVSENYDGGKTGQKGIHSFFEDVCLDELYPGIQDSVLKSARAEWPAFKKKNAGKTVLAMLEDLTSSSRASIPKLLAIDKAGSRKQPAKICARYKDLVTRRITASSLLLAEIYRRETGWTFDDHKFYKFTGEPAYIQPGGEVSDLVESKTAAH